MSRYRGSGRSLIPGIGAYYGRSNRRSFGTAYGTRSYLQGYNPNAIKRGRYSSYRPNLSYGVSSTTGYNSAARYGHRRSYSNFSVGSPYGSGSSSSSYRSRFGSSSRSTFSYGSNRSYGGYSRSRSFSYGSNRSYGGYTPRQGRTWLAPNSYIGGGYKPRGGQTTYVARPPQPENNLTISDASVVEGNQMSFTVSRTGRTDLASGLISVSFSNDTALKGRDYFVNDQTFRFGANETRKTIVVSTADDRFVEGTETFTAKLRSFSSKDKVTDAVGKGTIRDNDYSFDSGRNQVIQTAVKDEITGAPEMPDAPTRYSRHIEGRRYSSDRLTGTGFNDHMNGNGGNDILSGQNGQDYLNGGNGNDYLYGGQGADILEGASGSDRLHGGSGADTFILQAGNGYDTILDFEDGIDKIQLGSGIDTNNVTIKGGARSWDKAQYIYDGNDLLAKVQGSRNAEIELTQSSNDIF